MTRSDSPPPPMPSPTLTPTQLSPPRLSPTIIPSPLLLSTRSVDNIRAKAQLWVDGDDFGVNRSSSNPNTPSRTAFLAPKRHRRTPSVRINFPTHSPPPSPALASPPPPVPPIPAFALAPTDKKPLIHPRPDPFHIHIPDIDSLTSRPLHKKRSRQALKPQQQRPYKEEAMTCLKFFAIRNQGQTTPRVAV